MTRPFTAAAVAFVLVTATVLKVVRYSDPPVPLEQRAQRAVTAMMANAGWTPSGWRNLTTDGGVRTATFYRKGCAAPLSVVVITAGAEAAGLIQRDLGPGAIFLSVSDGFPELAIAAPKQPTAACRPPDEAAWSGLAEAIDDGGLTRWVGEQLYAGTAR